MVRLIPVLGLLVGSVALAAPSAQAKAEFDRGERELAAGNFEAAVDAYKKAIAASPGYTAAINGLGSALFKLGKKEEAIEEFKAALKVDPNFKLAWFNLGYAARKVGDFATAAQAYERYTKLDPSDPDGFYGLGESYRNLGQNAKAVAAYETFIEKEKRPTEQKWVEKAKETIAQLKAQQAQPAQPVAQPTPQQPTQGGQPSQPSAQPQTQPVAQPQPAPTGLPPGGSANQQLAARKIQEGDRLWQEKQWREASFAYQDAVNANPDSVEALFKLGNAYAVLGYYGQAIERWNRAAQLSTDPAVKKSAQDNIAKAQDKLAKQGASPQAAGKPPGSGPVADSTREKARQWYERGVAEIKRADYASAVKSLSQAIQLEPSLAVAYVARGSAHIGLRRFNEAAADYQYALRLDSSLASPLYGLAEAYRAMNRVADARAYYEKYASSTASDVQANLQSEARQKAESLR